MDYMVATLIVRMWSLIVGLILVCFGAGQAGFVEEESARTIQLIARLF